MPHATRNLRTTHNLCHPPHAPPAQAFQRYSRLVQDQLLPRFSGAVHWAKLEVPADPKELAAVQAQMARRFPVQVSRL